MSSEIFLLQQNESFKIVLGFNSDVLLVTVNQTLSWCSMNCVLNFVAQKFDDEFSRNAVS